MGTLGKLAMTVMTLFFCLAVVPLFGDGVKELLPGLASEDPDVRRTALEGLEKLCYSASRPGADHERTAVAVDLARHAGPQTPEAVRATLVRKLAAIGGPETVAVLAALLTDDSAWVREEARRALQVISVPQTSTVLSQALDGAESPEQQLALVLALSGRRDESLLEAFEKLAASPDTGVAEASINAVAEIASDAALEILREQRGTDMKTGEYAPHYDAATHAVLRAAEIRREKGDIETAKRIYVNFIDDDVSETIRAAAIRGVVVTATGADFETFETMVLGMFIQSPGDPLQTLAIRLAADWPAPENGEPDRVSRALLEELRKPVSRGTPVLIDVLVARGGPTAREAVLLGFDSNDADVRLAAVQAAPKLGDVSIIQPLLEVAADGSPRAVRRAARDGLLALSAAGTDETLLQLASSSPEASVAAEAARTLGMRTVTAATPTLLRLTSDPRTEVRSAAYGALESVIVETELTTVFTLVLNEADAGARSAGMDTVVGVALGSDDTEGCVRAFLAVETPDGDAAVTRIQILGRVGGPTALEHIRTQLHAAEPTAVDAAVRALARWDGSEPLPDLIAIARDSEVPNHRVFALRGIVRIVNDTSDRAPAEAVAILEQALAFAERDDERRQVLGALGRVEHPRALILASAELEEESLHDEAALAVASIARNLAWSDRELAVETLESLVQKSSCEAARDDATKALVLIAEYGSYVGTWLVSGPYHEKELNAKELFEQAFAPETTPDDAEWRALTGRDGDRPWIFDLTTLDTSSNRCAYVKAEIYSPSRREARLELGSDDGIRAWWNGQLVHSNPASRPVTPGDDPVDVELQEGWNPLVLKIVQGSGGWGFCAAIKGRDGVPFTDLQFRAR